MNNYYIKYADELIKIVGLGECLKDAQIGLLEANKDIENHIWLTQVITHKLRGVIKKMEAEPEQEDVKITEASYLDLKKAADTIINELNKLQRENSSLKKKLVKYEAKNRK
ncbi:MAG: hypothetical protein HUU44_03995 [Ignavibacteriaceae bacterium]|nr:hypothetical protein [Ignavibacteriaceae bacterium]MEB2297674.1 hypothetical protein [Ignavibacteria bacterium]NUM61298.1 hypothetical protein [Ignavibacteriaceae bacterium]